MGLWILAWSDSGKPPPIICLLSLELKLIEVGIRCSLEKRKAWCWHKYRDQKSLEKYYEAFDSIVSGLDANIELNALD